MSDFQFLRIKCTKFDFYWGSAPDLAKQGAVGRLGNVTKLLQRQRRDSQCQCNGVCRILSMEKPSICFPCSQVISLSVFSLGIFHFFSFSLKQDSHASRKVLDFFLKVQDLESPGKSLWSWKFLEIKA